MNGDAITLSHGNNDGSGIHACDSCVNGIASAETAGNYLTFTAQEAGSTISFNWNSGSDVQYREATDAEWTDYAEGTEIVLSNADDYVQFKGSNVITDTSEHFKMTGKVAASGSVTSLTDENGADANMKLTESCYRDMFSDCDSLISAPELPAVTLAEQCYSSMFWGCKGIKMYPDYSVEHAGEWSISAQAAASTDWNRDMFLNTGGDCKDSPEPGTVYYQSIPDSVSSIALDATSYTYDGTEICPAVTVKSTSGKLLKDTEYTVSYANNKNAGIGRITVEGIGDYAGKAEKSFTIQPASIRGKSAVLAKSKYVYSGKANKPAVTISGLNADTDFTVAYKENIHADTATAVIQGAGNYAGTITKTFTIAPASIAKKTANLSAVKYVYSGKAKKPVVTISGLVKGTDYTVAYKNNVKTGKATAAVKGKGNYKGTITKNFKIVPKKAVIPKLTPGKKKVTVRVTSKVGLTGGTTYQIAYKKKGAGKWKYATTTKKSKVIKKLKKGKRYYVKVRAYKTISKKRYYGAWSKTKLSKMVK